MAKFKEDFGNIAAALLLSALLALVCNRVGYDTGIMKSLPGLLILVVISLAGYFLSYIIPTKKITAVLWVSIIAILVASPISPVSKQVIYYVGNINLNAVVTPILAYSGVLIGKDWLKFKELGYKAIIVSVVVMIGTFLVSSWLGDLFMKIF